MKVILDTHVVLWWMDDDIRVTPRTRNLIADDSNEVLFSLASLWEIAIKHRIGKLSVGVEAVRDQLDTDRIAVLPISEAHLRGVQTFRDTPHNDPFDHLILAQAMTERARIVTGDAIIGRYGVPCIPV